VPAAVDPEEPLRVAEAADALGLSYVVVTSVTRDDLSDGGAGVFADTIRAIRKRIPEAGVEVLIPDMGGEASALETVMQAKPLVLNHNVETVPRLYDRVRPEADYQRSIDLIRRASENRIRIPVKSGLMLGLGEMEEEIESVLLDLFENGCRLLTLGQYLQPTPDHLPVKRFVPPEEFEWWRRKAIAIGFLEVASSPFVRSSYRAGEMYSSVKKKISKGEFR
jgi:lipoic acid synthetase